MAAQLTSLINSSKVCAAKHSLQKCCPSIWKRFKKKATPKSRKDMMLLQVMAAEIEENGGDVNRKGATGSDSGGDPDVANFVKELPGAVAKAINKMARDPPLKLDFDVAEEITPDIIEIISTFAQKRDAGKPKP
eukprot:TRINITY_DN75058_c0_g1_i1.p1 TRINITY_DN75058_c0_g1~~TRINITY_DN75058_c0_g1_i1.p1  ORF type:complete len:134 (+),score=19.07 TRINITY_DN75058_c0_g1_i1:135-536(+)